MDIKVVVGLVNDRGQTYYVVQDDDGEDILYSMNRDWWSDRLRGQSAETVRVAIGQQTRNYDSGPKRELGVALNATVRDRLAKSGKNGLSVLEIGCANGPTIRHLTKHFPNLELTFYGIELNGVLVDDFRRHFPQYNVIQGGVEEFVENDVSTFPHAPYDLFLASGTLCMVKPNMMIEVLRKAARLTNRFVFWEYLENRNGQISKDRPVFFELEGAPHYLFAHAFETLLKKIGFKIDVLEFTPPESLSHGAHTGIIVASRKGRKRAR